MYIVFLTLCKDVFVFCKRVVYSGFYILQWLILNKEGKLHLGWITLY